MKSVEFDAVKAEKAKAIRLYKSKRNFALLLRFAAVLAVMFSASSLSRWSFSCAVDTAGDLLRESELFFNRPVFMFTLLNLIIAILFFLSGQKTTSSDIYDEYVAVGSHRIAAVSGKQSEESLEKSKHIVRADNAERDDSEKTVTDTVNTVTDSDRSIRDELAVSVTVSDANEKKSYVRSKSEYIRRELGGSAMAVAELRWKSMDDLSNEEFRLKIERFIAAQKKSLIQENRADI